MRSGSLQRLGTIWRRKRALRVWMAPAPPPFGWPCLRTFANRPSRRKSPLPPLEHVRLGSQFDEPTREALEAVHDRLVEDAENNFIRVHTCWSTDDLKERPPSDRELGSDPDDRYERVRCHLPAVLTKAMEIYGTFRDLEYFNGHYWTPLQNDGQLLPYRNQVLRIRVPEHFEDIQLADSDDEVEWGEEEEALYQQYKEYARQFAESLKSTLRTRPRPSRRTSMETVIRDLAQQLLTQEYHRSPIRARTIVDRHQQALSTPTWVLQAAQEHTTLRSLLLAHPGALQHIVTCLHELDTLWRR